TTASWARPPISPGWRSNAWCRCGRPRALRSWPNPARPRGDAIIGEASYGFDRASGCGEFAISVSDRFQRKGLGSALLDALQCRAISLGHFALFGETLKTNDQMQSLARKAGFAASRALDWRAVRFDKRLSAPLKEEIDLRQQIG